MESINPECESLRYLHYEGKQFQRRPLLSDLAERMIPLIGVGPCTQYILHHNRHVFLERLFLLHSPPPHFHA